MKTRPMASPFSRSLKVGSGLSHRVLVEAAKGWYLADLRDKKTGEKPAYYDAHAMNLQRAYYIVCLMVGSSPEQFTELADLAKLPEERRQSCKGDFTTAQWSWETLLKPRLRAAEQPKQQVEVIYGEAKGKLEVYARMFRDLRFLEALAYYVAERFAWPAAVRHGDAKLRRGRRQLALAQAQALLRDGGGLCRALSRLWQTETSDAQEKALTVR